MSTDAQNPRYSYLTFNRDIFLKSLAHLSQVFDSGVEDSLLLCNCNFLCNIAFSADPLLQSVQSNIL